MFAVINIGYICFSIGFLSKSDIRASFDQVGRIVSDRELEEMLKEATGAINFTQFLQIFGNKVSGMDEEDVIFNAFTVFDEGDGFCSEDKYVAFRPYRRPPID